MILDINIFLSAQEQKKFDYKKYYQDLKFYKEKNLHDIKIYNQKKELKNSIQRAVNLIQMNFIQEYKNELINRMLTKYN